MNKLKNKSKAIIITVVFLLLIIIPTGFAYSNWDNNYRNRINPGVRIGNINFGGLTSEQAEEKIDAEANRLEAAGLPIVYGNKQIILPAIVSVSSDLSSPIFSYNREETLKQLLATSPKDSFSSYLSNYIKGKFTDRNIGMVYYLDKERAKAFILENLKDVEVEPENAVFKTKKTIDGELEFNIEPEKIGRKIDFELAYRDIDDDLKNLNNSNITVKTVTARPQVHVNDLEALKVSAEELIARGDLKLTASTTATSSSFVVKKSVLASWITSDGDINDLHISLDALKIADYLKSNIAPLFDQESKAPRYEINNGKMASWQTGSDGQKINIDNSIKAIQKEYLENKNNQVALAVDPIKNEVQEDASNLNIQEIIGTGHSNFAGSSVARRKNIAVGAAAVNGILIAPGEEFSLVKTLGEIDASSGYVEELVIKNNKTIPEYGGGLCQVGTTMFRSALASGLPITARQNHSYRVSYYEPAGTDAAIYDPWPDVRFVNDTNNYILIQTRIVKNDIYFDFWGKKDGRVASSTTPVIYNITKPAAAKLIETTDLKPGVKKCTEKAHNGADAYFDYKVTYASGEVKSNRFKSHYVPWQEVCLIGKSIATSSPTSKATSTPNTTGSSAATSTKTN